MSCINDLNHLERSLLFAKLSQLAYNNTDEAKKQAKKLGFTTTEFYDKDGAQAYRFMNKTDLVIACRGTEPTEFNDIKADLYEKNTVYAVFDNHKFGDYNAYIYKSKNKGFTWQKISNNLPENNNPLSITIDKEGKLYLQDEQIEQNERRRYQMCLPSWEEGGG